MPTTESVKHVRFTNPTNRGMERYKAGEVYAMGGSALRWLDERLGPDAYEVVAAPKGEAAAPGSLRKTKDQSRTASSRKKGTEASDKAKAKTRAGGS